MERWRKSSHLVRLPSFGARQKYSLAHTGRHYTEQDGITLLNRPSSPLQSSSVAPHACVGPLLTRATRPRVYSGLIFIYVLTWHTLLCLWSATQACLLSFRLTCPVASWRSASHLTLNLRGKSFRGGLLTFECELAFQKADELKFWCPL